MRRKRYQSYRLPLTILAGLVIALGMRAPVWGFGVEPSSGGGGGGGSVPAGKFAATIYYGLVAVTTGESGSALMELGNSGKEIASTSDLYLRPYSYLETVNGALKSVLFSKDGTTLRTNLSVPGGVCFGASKCSDSWPSSGGTSYWDVNGTNYLQPNPFASVMKFDKPVGGSPKNSNAVEVRSATTAAALNVANTSNSTSAIAGSFNGGANIGNDLVVDSRTNGDEIVLVDGATTYKVWHAGNDGHTVNGTGPDASKLDGLGLRFRYIQSNSIFACGGISGLPPGPSLPSNPHHCFCADFGSSSSDVRCVALQ